MDVKCQQMWVQEPTFQDMKKWKEYLQRTVENSAKMLKQDDGTRNSEMERMRRNIPTSPASANETRHGERSWGWVRTRT